MIGNENLISRRKFFSKSVSAIMPILALTIVPTFLTSCDPEDEPGGGGGGSSSGCSGCGSTCSTSCGDSCRANMEDVKELVCHLAKQDVSEDVNMEVDNQCEYIEFVSVYLHFFIM